MQSGDDARGDRVLESQRAAHGHGEGADLRQRCLERRRSQARAVRVKDRDIGNPVDGQHVSRHLLPVREGHAHLPGTLDHVGVGDDGAVGLVDDAAAHTGPGEHGDDRGLHLPNQGRQVHGGPRLRGSGWWEPRRRSREEEDHDRDQRCPDRGTYGRRHVHQRPVPYDIGTLLQHLPRVGPPDQHTPGAARGPATPDPRHMLIENRHRRLRCACLSCCGDESYIVVLLLFSRPICPFRPDSVAVQCNRTLVTSLYELIRQLEEEDSSLVCFCTKRLGTAAGS